MAVHRRRWDRRKNENEKPLHGMLPTSPDISTDSYTSTPLHLWQLPGLGSKGGPQLLDPMTSNKLQTTKPGAVLELDKLKTRQDRLWFSNIIDKVAETRGDWRLYSFLSTPRTLPNRCTSSSATCKFGRPRPKQEAASGSKPPLLAALLNPNKIGKRQWEEMIVSWLFSERKEKMQTGAHPAFWYKI